MRFCGFILAKRGKDKESTSTRKLHFGEAFGELAAQFHAAAKASDKAWNRVKSHSSCTCLGLFRLLRLWEAYTKILLVKIHQTQRNSSDTLTTSLPLDISFCGLNRLNMIMQPDVCTT